MPEDLESRISFSITPKKGTRNGYCNRKCCQTLGAKYYNSSTLKYYCRACARKINDANPGLCKLEN